MRPPESTFPESLPSIAANAMLLVAAEEADAHLLEDDASEDQEFERFREAAERGNLVPLYERIFADQLTPVTAYRCLVAEDDREAPSFLFESVVNGTQTAGISHPTWQLACVFAASCALCIFGWHVAQMDPSKKCSGLFTMSAFMTSAAVSVPQGRYSFVGAQPALEVVARGNSVTIIDHATKQRTTTEEDDPMAVRERGSDLRTTPSAGNALFTRATAGRQHANNGRSPTSTALRIQQAIKMIFWGSSGQRLYAGWTTGCGAAVR